MSKNEWEQGRWVLPTAAVPQFRKALRDAAATHHDALYVAAKQLHREIEAESKAQGITYLSALYRHQGRTQPRSGTARDYAYQILDWVQSSRARDGLRPRVPTRADVDGVAPRFNGNHWRGSEAHIEIDGRELHYMAYENNRAVERVRGIPVVVAMFELLRRTAWTRTSGGILMGNNEYNEDAWGHRLGAYTVGTWGSKSIADDLHRSAACF